MRKEMSDFLREYFMQTRREIDAEKSSRDNILNFAILTIGAVGFAMFQNDKVEGFVREPSALAIEISMVACVTVLFWLRGKKLHQIADRWFILHNILVQYPDEIAVDRSLEDIVAKDLRTTRYSRKDVAVCMGLSLPVYGLMAISLWSGMRVYGLILVGLIFGLHFAIALYLMNRRRESSVNGASVSGRKKVRTRALHKEEDMERVKEIWMRESVRVHNFVGEARDFWEAKIAQFENEVQQGKGFVCEEGGQVRGFIVMKSGGDGTCVQELFVEQESWNRRIGSELLTIADQTGKPLWLLVYVENLRAVEWYIRHGSSIKEHCTRDEGNKYRMVKC